MGSFVTWPFKHAQNSDETGNWALTREMALEQDSPANPTSFIIYQLQLGCGTLVLSEIVAVDVYSV